MEGSLPVSSVHEISQARILEWVAISFSRVSPQPTDQTGVFCIAGGFLQSETLGKPHYLFTERGQDHPHGKEMQKGKMVV